MDEKGGFSFFWKRTLISWMNWFVYRLSGGLIAVTPELKYWLMSAFGVPSSRVYVVPNGVNERIFRPMDIESARVQLGWRNDLSYIGYVGSIVPWQGLDVLIQSVPDVLRETENVHFVIGGDGLLREMLEEMVKQGELEKFFSFLGAVPYTQASLHIAGCDIVVAPFPASLRNTVTGLSPLKIYAYMSCARPVVTTNICGLDKAVGRSGAGIVVEPDDPRGLAGAMVALLRNDELRNRMGIRGRALVLRNFTWRKSAERIVEVLERILKP
jgi:glycosyltransferase involved in cell wall biosynthesis